MGRGGNGEGRGERGGGEEKEIGGKGKGKEGRGGAAPLCKFLDPPLLLTEYRQ